MPLGGLKRTESLYLFRREPDVRAAHSHLVVSLGCELYLGNSLCLLEGYLRNVSPLLG